MSYLLSHTVSMNDISLVGHAVNAYIYSKWNHTYILNLSCVGAGGDDVFFFLFADGNHG